MDISFIDTEKHRKWTYNDVRAIMIEPNTVVVTGWDEVLDKPYTFKENKKEFDHIELRKD